MPWFPGTDRQFVNPSPLLLLIRGGFDLVSIVFPVDVRLGVLIVCMYSDPTQCRHQNHQDLVNMVANKFEHPRNQAIPEH